MVRAARPCRGSAFPHACTSARQRNRQRLISAGPIWKFCLGGEERVIVDSQALMNEVCNEDRFSKIIAVALKQARNGVNDGLGTAYSSQEANWGIAHRTLAPHFGSLAIRSMFNEMHNIVG